MRDSLTFSGRKLSQNPPELVEFAHFIARHDVRSYCEVGARHGDTFHYLTQQLPVGSLSLAVDYPGGAWGKAVSPRFLNAATSDLRDKGYDARVIYGKSEDVVDQVAEAGPFDLIFIDADHRYEAVKRDWELYRPLAKTAIAFHDVCGDGVLDKKTGFPVEVHKLWAEILEEGWLVELFAVPNSKMGIGVVLL